MDLETSSAVVRPAEGESFDIAAIPPALDKAGFKAASVTAEIRGRVVEFNGAPLLEVPGVEQPFRLRGESLPEAGSTVSLTARLEEDGVLVVEDWQPAAH